MTLNSAHIKQLARELGFSACGMAPAAPLSEERQRELRAWLAEGCYGDMDYLARNVEKKLDVRQLVEGARTVVSFALNYFHGTWHTADGSAANSSSASDADTCNAWHLARYAYGTDYHEVVKQKLRCIMQRLGLDEPTDGRAFVDTAPVDEKYWAQQCGIGWRGRSGQLILPGMGSYFFLGELVLTHDADHYDAPMANHCGSCHQCVDACPMQALRGDGTMDARRCLSYLTIEKRGELPDNVKAKLGNCFYGCDRCAEACPWNARFATLTTEPALQPRPSIMNMTPNDWQHLSVEQYRELFTHSAVKRAKYEGLTRNLSLLTPNNDH